MAACVRAFLALVFVTNVRCGLLPIDLSGVSTAGLPNLGLNTPSGGVLTSLGNVISTGLGTVESLGTDVLGKLTLHNGHIDPKFKIRFIEPWELDWSYSAYKKNVHRSSNGRRPISYAEWINIIHGDLESNEYDSSLQSKPQVLKPTLEEQIHNTGILNNEDKPKSHIITLDSIGSSLGNLGTVVPKIPTVYKDNQGRLYYIIQPNVNQVNRPIQTIPSNHQVYTIVNYNGQQVLVPVSTLATYPSTTARTYVFVPANNLQSQTPANPVVSYVTTPKNVSYEKLPAGADPEIGEGSNLLDNKEKEVDSTREESEAVAEIDESALKIDVRK